MSHHYRFCLWTNSFGYPVYHRCVMTQFNINEKLVPFVAASYEERRYGGPDPLFLVTRNDNQYDARLGITYTPAKLWSVTPQVSYTRNDSNVIINRFDRVQALVTVRRDFR